MSSKGDIFDNYRYTKNHEWIKRDEQDDQIVIIGITDYAQHELGDIVHIEIPGVGDNFSEEDELGVIESAKAASEFYAPLSGRVVEVNCTLDSHPEKVNNSPYEDGWIVKMQMDNPDDLDDLLSADGYRNYLEEEV